jgi:thiol peroxidase
MATQERPKAAAVNGNPLTLIGPQIKVGDKAPDFTAASAGMEPVSLAAFKGKTKVLLSVPSLDTQVCDLETRRFNEEAAKLPGVRFVVLSVDLPFAQKRFCSTAGIRNVTVLSDYKDHSFGRAYGTLIKENRLLARAVFVADGKDRITYVEYVPDITHHPDYDAVLGHLRETVKA